MSYRHNYPLKQTQRRTSDPTKPAVELSDVRTHVRDLPSDDEDYVMNILVPAATNHVENVGDIALITQTWATYLDRFPHDDQEICLHRSPVQSVSSVTYYDGDNTQQTWSSSNYDTDVQSRPGRVRPVESQVWPDTYYRLNAVTVTWVAGYGDTHGSVPGNCKLAVLYLVGEMYRNREILMTPQMQQQVSMLLEGEEVETHV